MNQTVPVLVYHHIYPDCELDRNSLSGNKATGIISLSEFQSHLSYIYENGWEAVSTTRIVNWLNLNLPLPKRAIAIHFDNGWLDTFSVALPVLKAFGMTATSFVITSGATAASEGKIAPFRTSTEGKIQKPCITWKQVEQLIESGWEIGAHTATHPPLGELYTKSGEEAVVEEIEGSNDIFMRELGFVPAHFAYPSGSRSEQTDRILKRYYMSLRLWNFSQPPVWKFTNQETSPLSMECQNIDSTVSFKDFTRIFSLSQS